MFTEHLMLSFNKLPTRMYLYRTLTMGVSELWPNARKIEYIHVFDFEISPVDKTLGLSTLA
jgi:hypothetical protein